jgi:integrase
MRRNEADKAEWSWFFGDSKGRRFIEIRETPFFVPKSKQSRVIPVDETLWDALLAIKTHERFIVDGPDAIPRTPETEVKSAVYRCDQAHRVLVAWLRKLGVDDPKPCHRLRKEFGSYVSTTFGLFHAQRFLGHSSPTVTSDYYAGLTDLPEIRSMPIKLPCNDPHGPTEAKKNHSTL